MGVEGQPVNYFESRASEYSQRSRRGLWHFVRQRELNTVIRLLTPELGASAIDLGCGTGYYGHYLQEQWQMKVIGVDSSPKMVAQARLQGLGCICAELQKLPKLGRFDYAVAAGSLEFVEAPEKIFERIGPMVRRKLVIMVPHSDWRGRIYRLAHHGCETYIRSADDYARMLRIYGFDLEARATASPISMALAFVKRLAPSS